MTQRPAGPVFQCYRKATDGRVFYTVPAAPELEPIEITGLIGPVAAWKIERRIGTHFDLEPHSFDVEFH